MVHSTNFFLRCMASEQAFEQAFKACVRAGGATNGRCSATHAIGNKNHIHDSWLSALATRHRYGLPVTKIGELPALHALWRTMENTGEHRELKLVNHQLWLLLDTIPLDIRPQKQLSELIEVTQVKLRVGQVPHMRTRHNLPQTFYLPKTYGALSVNILPSQNLWHSAEGTHLASVEEAGILSESTACGRLLRLARKPSAPSRRLARLPATFSEPRRLYTNLGSWLVFLGTNLKSESFDFKGLERRSFAKKRAGFERARNFTLHAGDTQMGDESPVEQESGFRENEFQRSW